MSQRKKVPNSWEPKKPKPDMWESPEQSIKSKSLENENRLAKEIGFKATPASGNTSWISKKGDGEHEVFMFEIKETEKSSLSINRRAIAKLCREAALAGKEPALIFSVHGLPSPLPKEWIAVPKDIFSVILKLLTKQ